MTFEVKILGSNSASFAHGRHHTSQVVCHGGHLLLVDCGEATQLQLQRHRVKVAKLSHIFISHLHGDHCYGLPGLLNTLAMAGRSAPLTIVGPHSLEEWLATTQRMAQAHIPFAMHMVHTSLQPGLSLVADLPRLQVFSFPVQHRLPTTGFLFREKPHPRHLLRDTLPPQVGPDEIKTLIAGQHVLHPDGSVHLNYLQHTRPGRPQRAYAYCADTAYLPSLAQLLQGVDLLYHEATFEDSLLDRAAETLHSTAGQAGQLAQHMQARALIIGHFSSRYRETDLLLSQAQAHFPTAQEAKEGATFSIPFQEELVENHA